jgi:hypothetical protein
MTDRDLMQQALEAMGAVGADAICEASHHAKKDQHKWGEPCPLQQRWHIAYQALRERLAQPEQEPFGYFRYDLRLDAWVQNRAGLTGTPFYTAPPRREWVGLTEEDLVECDEAEYKAARYWEAKLKEKNG